MKGEFTIIVKNKCDVGSFPMTETWTYNVDSTPECMSEIVEIFNKILSCLGYGNKVDIVTEENFESEPQF